MRDRLEELEADVLLVSFEQAERVRTVTGSWTSRWPVLVDEGREVYTAFGLARASALRVWLSPATVWYYAKAATKGRFLRLSGADTGQMGGDFIIDRSGILRYAHLSREPADRPPAETLLRRLSELP